MRFLAQQLSSLEAQTWPHIDLYISDDGSTDGTWDYLQAYCASWSKGAARLVRGPQKGSATENFRFLIISADPAADFVAYCDQDDIWLPTKLENAIRVLDAKGDAPALHCARTTLIDEAGRRIGESVYFRRPPDFRNAIVQSLAGGNTMVMNRAAFALVQESSRRTSYVAHDWWTYMIVTGAGGTIVYSSEPDTLYRQHAGNAIGSNQGWPARMLRFSAVLRGRFREWNERNVAALLATEDLLNCPSRRVLATFANARRGGPAGRWRQLRTSGIFRQTSGGQVMLHVACLLDVM